MRTVEELKAKLYNTSFSANFKTVFTRRTATSRSISRSKVKVFFCISICFGDFRQVDAQSCRKKFVLCSAEFPANEKSPTRVPRPQLDLLAVYVHSSCGYRELRTYCSKAVWTHKNFYSDTVGGWG